ncbi:Hypothetical predicted protein [Podarcis lilfordi]|uniref:Uncharacterized protein n=1 Tax=Podarcis lilfordi TaxID=74358 RepID=A0AA35LD54_9SAUR|nr:Hypothetical predicted protein [Podarcis lilfordi]
MATELPNARLAAAGATPQGPWPVKARLSWACSPPQQVLWLALALALPLPPRGHLKHLLPAPGATDFQCLRAGASVLFSPLHCSLHAPLWLSALPDAQPAGRPKKGVRHLPLPSESHSPGQGGGGAAMRRADSTRREGVVGRVVHREKQRCPSSLSPLLLVLRERKGRVPHPSDLPPSSSGTDLNC